jgi:hypothetical protein
MDATRTHGEGGIFSTLPDVAMAWRGLIIQSKMRRGIVKSKSLISQDGGALRIDKRDRF